MPMPTTLALGLNGLQRMRSACEQGGLVLLAAGTRMPVEWEQLANRVDWCCKAQRNWVRAMAPLAICYSCVILRGALMKECP